MYYTENWEDPLEFQPDLAVSVEPRDIEQWEYACREYALFRGEVSAFPYVDYYRALARVRGCERMTSTGYAQCFGLTDFARRRRADTI